MRMLLLQCKSMDNKLKDFIQQFFWIAIICDSSKRQVDVGIMVEHRSGWPGRKLVMKARFLFGCEKEKHLISLM